LLSAEVCIASNIQRRVEHLQRLLDDTANNTEGTRISMSLVEAINTAQNEYNQCVNRQHKLLGDLKQKRSDRLSKKMDNSASILNLVEAWKDEETRIQMIELADRQKGSLENEIEKLADMDDLKCRILGISKDEALNG
jgi:phosphoenolpyruvate carboxylase